MEDPNKQGPAYKAKIGSVTATVWKRTVQKNNQSFQVYDTVIENNYKDKDGNWQSNSKFNLNDLPKVEIVAKQTYTWIHEDKRNDKTDTSD